MRLKGKFVALIAVVMIVLTAVLASWIVGSVQGSRVAYVAVRADRASYSIGENVTFSLVPLSQDVQFTVDGGEGGGVYIIRLPDDIDPETYLDDPNVLNDLMGLSFYHTGGETKVPLPRFSSSGEPLQMSWNGTINSSYSGNRSWEQATAGHYLLYPAYSWQYGHATKFMLERASIFRLDGLGVKMNISLESSVYTIRADLTLPAGAAPVSGLFTTALPDYGEGYNLTTVYHNETLDLRPGETSTVTLTYAAQDGGYGSTGTSLIARFITDERTYLFGFDSYIRYSNSGAREVHYVQY